MQEFQFGIDIERSGLAGNSGHENIFADTVAFEPGDRLQIADGVFPEGHVAAVLEFGFENFPRLVPIVHGPGLAA
ncbi:hypothetical protein D3C81_1324810 [compost metagenome]